MNIGYVVSSIIAGIIMVSLVTLNMRVSRNSGEQTLYGMANTHAGMVAEYFREDMRSMGYGIQGNDVIQEADSSQIRFLVHFEDREEPTEIGWSFAADAATSYENSDIHPLYRTVDGASEPVGTGVTRFELVYLDKNRQVLDSQNPPLTEIRQIRLNLVVESTEGYGGGQYGRSTWAGEVTPYNLD